MQENKILFSTSPLSKANPRINIQESLFRGFFLDLSGRKSLSHANCLIFQFTSLSHKICGFSEIEKVSPVKAWCSTKRTHSRLIF